MRRRTSRTPGDPHPRPWLSLVEPPEHNTDLHPTANRKSSVHARPNEGGKRRSEPSRRRKPHHPTMVQADNTHKTGALKTRAHKKRQPKGGRRRSGTPPKEAAYRTSKKVTKSLKRKQRTLKEEATNRHTTKVRRRRAHAATRSENTHTKKQKTQNNSGEHTPHLERKHVPDEGRTQANPAAQRRSHAPNTPHPNENEPIQNGAASKAPCEQLALQLFRNTESRLALQLFRNTESQLHCRASSSASSSATS